MKTYDFEVGGQLVQLRLTTGKLNQYLEDTHADSQAPILGVLDAMTNLGKRIRLMTAAPTKKGTSCWTTWRTTRMPRTWRT